MTGCSFSVVSGWMPVLEATLLSTNCICFGMAIIYPCFALIRLSTITLSITLTIFLSSIASIFKYFQPQNVTA